MMLEKEWSCNLFEMPIWNQYEPLFTNCMKRGMQTITSKEKAPTPTSSGPRKEVDLNY
jgi:hypothetical protein